MRKKTNRNLRDTITTIIAYAVLLGPVIILVVMLMISYFGKIISILDPGLL